MKFFGERRDIEANIILQEAWEGEKQFTTIINFIIMKVPATYKATFGPPLLNTFRAMVLIYHIAVKFIA